MKAAKQGYVEAQYELAKYYEEGRGTFKNERKAFERYKKAAEQGNAEVQSE